MLGSQLRARVPQILAVALGEVEGEQVLRKKKQDERVSDG